MKITKKYESSAVNTFKNGSPVEFFTAKGEYLFTKNKKKYLDLVCGSAVTNLGHSHKSHEKAINKVLKTGIFHTGTRLTNQFREELYSKLNFITPSYLNSFHLCNSGSEAVETAIKAAQYYSKKKNIISFSGGYHGRTMGSLSLTHNKKLKDSFHTLKNVTFFPYPGTYKNKNTKYTEEECLSFAKKYFKNTKKPTCAAIIECGQAVSGIILPNKKFFLEIFKIFKKNNILIIVDEIWNGFGRTGNFFSFQNFNLKPDLVCAGKAMSSSLPLSVVLGPSKILKTWPPGIHTSTFQGNPLSCAMASATIDEILKSKLINRAKKINQILRDSLSKLNKLPSIFEVRTHGAGAGIEFIYPDGSANSEIVKFIEKQMLKKNIIVYAGGERNNVLMLIPPLIIKFNNLKNSLKVLVEEIYLLKKRKIIV